MMHTKLDCDDLVDVVAFLRAHEPSLPELYRARYHALRVKMEQLLVEQQEEEAADGVRLD